MEGMILAIGTTSSSFWRGGGRQHRQKDSQIGRCMWCIIMVHIGYSKDSGAGLLGLNPDPAAY